MKRAAKTGAPSRAARPEIVYRKLRELIVRGQLAPGTRIVETDVAQRLGVSRTPVRGALQRLQQEGYIVDSPALQQSRPTVAPLTREDERELFSIVAEVEGLAARIAAQRPVADREKLVAELTAINEQFRKAAEAKQHNHNRLWELDERFHRTYVEAAAGPRLLALYEAVKPQAERYERIYVSLLARDLSPSVGEHAAIIRAIKGGNADVAQHAVQTNWRNAAERLGNVITSVGERGQW
ncbi:MAG TPA: GntR family transcriptional regulator [Gemmatimonadaceae bacterium]|nr:GntR family transcriptional regulator [Gemmatimonadaceae bacterium]